MQLRETFRNNGNTGKHILYAVSASLVLHICIALILITSTAISTRLKLDEDPIIHVSLISMNTGQKPYSNKLPEYRIQEKGYSKSSEGIVEPVAVVKPIEKKDRTRLPVEIQTHPVAEIQSINPTFVAISQLTGTGTKDVPSMQKDHKGQEDVNSSTGEVSLIVPRYRENTHPVYPLIARMRGYEGIVLLSVEIFANGRVGKLNIKRSSGYAVLDRSALEAVRTWKFEPAKRANFPLTVTVDIPIRFYLNDHN
jgi:protein TonB